MVVDAHALLQRLGRFLDGFAECFVRRAHGGHAKRYVEGLLSDAKAKNMEGLLSRLVEPGDYQSLQHFMTHSTWEADAVWKQLRGTLPEQRGYLIIDDTSIPKQGNHSVGVARQYCGALGKVANCQSVVTTALRTEHHTWPLSMQLYLLKGWCTARSRRKRADVPASIVHQTKLEMALSQIDVAIKAGIVIDCVLADAAYGEATEFREAIAARGLHYAVGVSKTLTVFPAAPTFKAGRTRSRRVLADGSVVPQPVEALVDFAMPGDWQRICWRNGVQGKLEAEFLIRRVIPAHDWRRGQTHDEVWLICERTLGEQSVRKYHLTNLPATLPAKELVRVTHERWAIEMQYRDLKQELGLDHFEGRSFPGFARHLVLTALAYTFLQLERRRGPEAEQLPSLAAVRRSVTEILTAMLFTLGERFASLVAQLQRDPPPG